jgi:hypothetical protein
MERVIVHLHDEPAASVPVPSGIDHRPASCDLGGEQVFDFELQI